MKNDSYRKEKEREVNFIVKRNKRLGYSRIRGISHLRPFHVQGLRNANYRERTTQKAHADMYNTRSPPLFIKVRHGCI